MINKNKPTPRQRAESLERYKPEDEEYFRNLIMERRAKILIEFGILTEQSRNTIEEYSGDHSTYSLHPADQGTNAQEREKSFLLASREGR